MPVSGLQESGNAATKKTKPSGANSLSKPITTTKGSTNNSQNSDSSSLDSESSKSGRSSVKKRIEKEKLKRIEALKNELIRRQQK
jgi:hypothetical protein